MQHNIIITGVGGQGVVTLGLIISTASINSGKSAIMSEIHGLAQRGGSVSVDVRIGNYRAPIIPDGDADLLIALEPIEALRALGRIGPGTKVVMSTEKMPPVSLGIRRMEYPPLDRIIGIISKQHEIFPVDAVALARNAGSVKTLNTVIAGFISGLGMLDVPESEMRDTILKTFAGKYADMNGRAFEAGILEAGSRLKALEGMDKLSTA